jgi:PmbA protein
VAGGGSSLCHLGVTAVAGGDEPRTGSQAAAARHPDGLDPEAVGAGAAANALAAVGARPAPSGPMPVLFEPRPAAELLARLLRACDAEAMRLGRSVLAGRLGELVAAPAVTVVDDPGAPASATAEHHDGEGLWSRLLPLIEAGVLVGALHTSTSARRAGAAPTGSARRPYSAPPRPGARSLRLLPGPHPEAGLAALVGDGLLVREVSGLGTGVHPAAGTFSVGVEGELLRGGAPAGPIRATTVAGTLTGLLAGVEAVGDREHWLAAGGSGAAMVVAELTVTGT